MKNISVIGAGYVGLVTATCLSELGNNVVCAEANGERLGHLNQGRVPFFEPGLSELMNRNIEEKRLRFVRNVAEAVDGSEIVYIAVGTPSGADGHANLEYVRDAANDIARNLTGATIIVNKSTVPVETGDLVAAIVREHADPVFTVHVVSNPEFLREGSAISDFMSPDRIVLGVLSDEPVKVMRDLYAPLNAPVIVTDIRTAEMIKYTANSFLAMKISFINEIAMICESLGADVNDVANGAGADKRIGHSFLNAGLGFGGSCFPKDVLALSKMAHAKKIRTRILDSVLAMNKAQVPRTVERLESALDGLRLKKIGVLGLAFKPNTDDVRESPAIALANTLSSRGAEVSVHDPIAAENAKHILAVSTRICAQSYEVAKGADAVVLATEWNEYRQLDFGIMRGLMRGNVLLDGRNIYDPNDVTSAGLSYIAVGRRSQYASPSPRPKP